MREHFNMWNRCTRLGRKKRKKKMDNHRRIRDDNENYYGITMITCYIAE